MKKPPQELIDAFFKWYPNDPHFKNEDDYSETITRDHLSGLSKSDFIDFFYTFAHEGGHVQSGGYRTSGKFREMLKSNYAQFSSFVLRPFDTNFDEANWLVGTKAFKYFGIGLATIYLNRVDKKRFPILNNKAADSLALFDVSLPSDTVKRYKAVLEAQQQLMSWFPQFDNFYRSDALNQFLIGEKEGQLWKKMLSNGAGPAPDLLYWIFQGNQKNYDVISALRDGALRTWSVNQHKKEIKTGDRVIIWLTGENNGCYGLATVMSEVLPSEEDAKEGSYRIKPTENGASEGVTIRIDKNLWNAPVLRAELDALPGFSDFPAGRQGTNLKITEAHFKDIQELVLGRIQMRYWVYAPGPNAKFWDECWEKRIMLFGADELVDLMTYKSKDDIEKALKKASALKSRPTNDSLAAWEFSRVVKPGDVIIAKKGRRQYIGYGIVTSPYVYDTSRVTYRNLRTVDWKTKGEWDEPGGSIVLKALTDITKHTEYVEKLKSLIGIDDQSPPISKPMPMPPALNTILYGPPGTGKTYALIKYMECFVESKYITFHQSYCYEDFVEGIKPLMSDVSAGKLSYEIKPGIFKNMVNMALNDPDHNYALLIDEINRGNVASIFGELIALIEEDKRKGAPNELPPTQLPYSRERFVVPGNLYIIGAMNTADRSVEALDTALRRRFTFVAISPDPKQIGQPGNLEVDLQHLLITINARIEKLLDKDHCIGHSYFMGIAQTNDPLGELRNIFSTRILPLLEEYFYGDPAKIGMVLGERFVMRKDETIEWAAGDWGVDEFEERRVYALQDPMTLKVEDFRAVYE